MEVLEPYGDMSRGKVRVCRFIPKHSEKSASDALALWLQFQFQKQVRRSQRVSVAKFAAYFHVPNSMRTNLTVLRRAFSRFDGRFTRGVWFFKRLCPICSRVFWGMNFSMLRCGACVGGRTAFIFSREVGAITAMAKCGLQLLLPLWNFV